MKRGLIFFARGVVYLVGLAALVICLVLLPELAREETAANPDSANLTLPFLTGAYILAAPFFIALYQSHKLLQLIDNNKAFSKQSIKALQNIKICSIVFSILVVISVTAGIALIRSVDPHEDVTFMFPIGFVFAFVPSVIAVFAAVLQKLLTEAMTMKSENDLIV